jgi:hypothetical protein
MNPIKSLMIPVLMVLASGCSSPGPLQRMEARLVEVDSVSGAPVESFHFWNLDRWEPLGRKHVAVWTRINEAWLIEVQEPCSGLDFTHVIGLSSTGQRVYRKFDDVHFENQRCRIAEIRPIDVKALRALRREPEDASAA